jgi:hypothetical protein
LGLKMEAFISRRMPQTPADIFSHMPNAILKLLESTTETFSFESKIFPSFSHPQTHLRQAMKIIIIVDSRKLLLIMSLLAH